MTTLEKPKTVIDRIDFIIETVCSPEHLLDAKKTLFVLSGALVGSVIDSINFPNDTLEYVGTAIKWFAWGGSGCAGFMTAFVTLKKYLKERKTN